MSETRNFRLQQLQGRLGDLMYQFTKTQFSHTPAPDRWAPAVNAYRCARGFAICVDLAGMDKDQIEVEVQPRRVRLHGTRPGPEPKGKEQEPRQILAMEIDCGPFQREIALPADVEPDAVRAEYKEGYLWVFLPFRSQG